MMFHFLFLKKLKLMEIIPIKYINIYDVILYYITQRIEKPKRSHGTFQNF